jgi:type I restriction enzyme S subunit
MTVLHATIPKDWRQINLERECFFERGMEPGADAYNTEGIGDRFIRVADVTRSRNNSVFVDGIHTTKRVRKNDILLTLDGTVGAVIRGLEGIYSTGVRKVSFRNAKYSDRLLYYLLQSADVQRTIDVYASGSTIKHASSAIPYLTALIPEQVVEQNKIADVLELIDQVIDKTDALTKKYEHIRMGMMQDLFRYGIDENGHVRSEKTHKFKTSSFGKIPAEWDVQLLDTLAERGSGHTPNKSHPEYWNGGIGWVSLADSSALDSGFIYDTAHEISIEGIKHSSAVLHSAGTVILLRDAGVGKSAILGKEMAVSQHFISWTCSQKLDNEFLYYWLQQDKKTFENIASGSTIVTIGLSFFKQYTVPFPVDIDEQRRIVTALKNIEKLERDETIYLKKMQNIKSGLMRDFLFGIVNTNHLTGK